MNVTEIIKSILLIITVSIFTDSIADDHTELAKAAQNPVADMISLPFQNNINGGIGANNETQNILNIQPVLPIEINEDWNVITRTILPVVSQPEVLTGTGRINGLGDMTLSTFLSPAKSDTFIWGAGPIFLIPTASDDKLGNNRWGMGATAVVLTMPGHWVYFARSRMRKKLI